MKRRSFLAAASSITAMQFLSNTMALFGQSGQPRTQATGNLLRIPATWDGVSDLDVRFDNVEIWQGKNTRLIVTGGYPGVTISKRKDDLLNVVVNNQLTKNTAVHWHGLDVPPDMDGHPKDEFTSGTSRNYKYRVRNRAGMYFYHSHANMQTGNQVYNGLFGLFRVTDDEEEALGLPSGEHEIPLVIQDVRIDAQYQLLYSLNMVDRMEGYLGNTILVNGTPDAYLPVKRGTYRLRLVNASNARIYQIAFSDKRPFLIIGSDGGLLAAPVSTNSVRLAPGERYDILTDFSLMSISQSVTLVSQSYVPPIGHMGSPLYPQGTAFDLVRFDVVAGEAPVYTAPSTLSSIARFDAQTALRTRTFDLQMQMMGAGHTINGKSFGMGRIDLNVNANELEVWEFVNKDADMMHPMHIHGGQFQILSRNGSANIPDWEKGWKDTFIVDAGEKVQVGVRFDNYDGVFLLHCHNLEHEDEGMMLNYEVVKATGVYEELSGTQQVWYSPASDAVIIRGSTLVENARCTIYDVSGHSVLIADLVGNDVLDVQLSVKTLTQGIRTSKCIFPC